MTKGRKVYEGKAKILFETSDPEILWQEFKDDATAFNAQKRGTIVNKGIVNNKLSAKLFELLAKKGIPNHFVKLISDREMLVRRVKIIPCEVVIRNITAGSLCKRFGIEEGRALARPSFELYLKNDALGDPGMTEDQALLLGFITEPQLKKVRAMALRVNELLRNYLKARRLILVDFKLEFGVDGKKRVLLADEISPDTCRLWDAKTRKKLDKDRFRQDLGNVEQAYHEVLRRIVG